jgi:hypothetical protein
MELMREVFKRPLANENKERIARQAKTSKDNKIK